MVKYVVSQEHQVFLVVELKWIKVNENNCFCSFDFVKTLRKREIFHWIEAAFL